MLIQLSIHSSDLRTLVYLLQKIEIKRDSRLANPLKNIIYLQRYPMCFYLLHIGAPICFVKTVMLRKQKKPLIICFNCRINTEIDNYYVLHSRLGKKYLMDKRDYLIYLIREDANKPLFSNFEQNLENFKLYKNPSCWKNFEHVKDKDVVTRLENDLKKRLDQINKKNEENYKELTKQIREKMMVKDIEKSDNIHVYRSSLTENKRCKVIKMLHFKQFNFTLLGELKHKNVKPKKKTGTSLYKLIKIIGEQKIYREQLSSFIFENRSESTV